MLKKLFVFQWHITDSCSNRCSHCYIKDFGKTNVSIETALNIIDDMKECCEQMDAEMMLSITGGDPLLHPSIWQILKKTNSIGAQIGILGNPELLNESVVEKLITSGVRRYQVSLDGIENTHDKIRSKGSFDRTAKSIKLLARMGMQVNVMSTVSEMNYMEMVDVMKYVYSLGAQKWSFARWVPDKGNCDISPEKYHDFMKSIVSEHEIFTKEGKSIPTKEPLMASIVSRPVSSDRISGGCGLGSSLLTVLPDNTVMACRRHAGSELGKWKKKGDFINFFLFHPKMDTYRDIKKIDKCGKCDFLYQCRGCRAVAFSSTGKNFTRDPHCFLPDAT